MGVRPSKSWSPTSRANRQHDRRRQRTELRRCGDWSAVDEPSRHVFVLPRPALSLHGLDLAWSFQSSMAVGPEGGTLHSGRRCLSVPLLAVHEQTVISIKDLPANQVNAILSNPALSSTRTKRFLGGFSAEPSGLVFDAPVTAVVPVSALNPYETPVQIEVSETSNDIDMSPPSLSTWEIRKLRRRRSIIFRPRILQAVSSQQLNEVMYRVQPEPTPSTTKLRSMPTV